MAYELVGQGNFAFGDLLAQYRNASNPNDHRSNPGGAYRAPMVPAHIMTAMHPGQGGFLGINPGTPANPVAYAPPGTGAAVVDRAPSKTRRFPMPVNSVGTVAAGASQVCSTQPQTIAFRPSRIIVPSSIAPDFTIDTIFCGIKPQFVATGSFAAETWTQDARDVEMLMDTVNTSQNFTLGVTNQSGAARQFRATVIGVSADD